MIAPLNISWTLKVGFCVCVYVIWNFRNILCYKFKNMKVHSLLAGVVTESSRFMFLRTKT
jgi:hypothetical protein